MSKSLYIGYLNSAIPKMLNISTIHKVCYVLERICIIGFLIVASPASASYNERRLLKDLLRDYDVDTRPVLNDSHPVVVTMDLGVAHLLDMDERNQIMTTMCWLRFYWRDEFLQWNVSEYGGVATSTLNIERIWKPDLTLYSNARRDTDYVKDKQVFMTSRGDLTWLQPSLLKTACSMNVLYFPYDTQRCPIAFSPWIHHVKQIDVFNKTARGDTSVFNADGEWNLVRIEAKKTVDKYKCCKHPFATVTFTLVLRRQYMYYMFNLFLPCVLLSILTLIVFYLPCESGEKVSLAVTVLLSLTVFLLIISEAMPPTSDYVPIIGQYYMATMALLSLSTGCTVTVLSVHHRGSFSAAPPLWLKKFSFNIVAPILCLRSYIAKELGQTSPENMDTKNTEDKSVASNALQRMVLFTVSSKAFQDQEANGTTSNGSTKTNGRFFKTANSVAAAVSSNKVNAELKKEEPDPAALSRKYLKEVRDSMRSRDTSDLVKLEWSMVSLVLDRFFLAIFSILTIFINFGIFITLVVGREND